MTRPRYPRPYTLTRSDEELCQLYGVARRLTMTKTQAQQWVGGRRRLERYVRDQKIRIIKKGDAQNAPWECNAEDVLRVAANYWADVVTGIA